MKTKFLLLSIVILVLSCSETTPSETITEQPIQSTKVDSPSPTKVSSVENKPQKQVFKLGAAVFLQEEIANFKNKNLALVVNQTSMLGETHLVDTLLASGIAVKTIFAPEHGFRGKADAGEKVESGKDVKTGLPIISLYGKHKKPTATDLKGIDVVVFDIQDVGARFYTYISTMHYVMEACAELNIPMLVLDRPNPNGHYVDGPVLEEKYKSFVGMHPVPVVHGMTIGEYAKMINGEGWLGAKTCDLTVIACQNYTHDMEYVLPVKPSPNLPNQRSIYLYPSLCFFEGTTISVGRGTNMQFQLVGHPKLTGTYIFKPKSMAGAKYPKHKDKSCMGVNLTTKPTDFYKKNTLDWNYMVQAYTAFPDKDAFFLKNNFFEKLAGTDRLRTAIIEGKTAEEISAMWKDEVEAFKLVRAKYLMY